MRKESAVWAAVAQGAVRGTAGVAVLGRECMAFMGISSGRSVGTATDGHERGWGNAADTTDGVAIAPKCRVGRWVVSLNLLITYSFILTVGVQWVVIEITKICITRYYFCVNSGIGSRRVRSHDRGDRRH